jgi:acyl-CoA thioester hydrolase
VAETPDQPVLHEIGFRLAYGDCDLAGIVYFAAYYPWFERVYNEWAFLGGFPPARMVELWGATHVSVASGCRYRIPGRIHDPLVCRMRLGRIGTTSFTPHFTIEHAETGETFAEGDMTFVFIEGAAGGDVRPRPTPVPQGLRDVLVAAGCTV